MAIRKIGILEAVGNTPMAALEVEKCQFMAKLEYMNLFGSMKDRATTSVILKLLKRGTINKGTTIVESSSGNFAIALSAVCSALSLKCICVVDRFLTKTNQHLIEQYGAKLIWVDKPNNGQSYQEKRIETARKLAESHKNTYWTNQYNNPLIQKAYFTLAEEITHQHPQVEFIYVPVSTCGTIAGIATWIKRCMPHVKVVAVDIYGSKIFGSGCGKSKFPGMGSRFKPGNLQNAVIDEVVFISNYECVINCQLLLKQGVFAGASSGGVVAAVRKTANTRKNIVAILPDRGDRYLESLYSVEWCEINLPQLLNDHNSIIKDYPLLMIITRCKLYIKLKSY